MNSKIERELLKATGEKSQDKDESRQDYLVRIGKAVSAMKDTEYDALSQEATDWYSNAISAKKAKKDIPDFNGGGKQEKPKKSAKAVPEKKKTAKGKKAAKARKADGKGTGTKRGEGVKPRLYAFLKGGGKGTPEHIAKKLGANIGTVRSKLFALGSKEWCIGKPLNIKRDDNGVYHL